MGSVVVALTSSACPSAVWNPDSVDTLGLLAPDWRGISWSRVNLLTNGLGLEPWCALPPAHQPCHCSFSPVWRFSAHVQVHRTPAGPELKCARVPTGIGAAPWQQLRTRRGTGGMQLADDVDACGRDRSSGVANAVSQALDVRNTADVSARQTARRVNRTVEQSR